ncbi:MAG: hypothetical protein IJZ24_03115 [Clostridia bacterium]|nr:hypothetical protein [Clostridia bacterium]
MVEALCLMLLTATIVLMFVFMFSSRKIPVNFGGKSLLFVAVLSIFFALIFKPAEFIRWDLIEHFKLVDNMREGGIKYVVEESQYADLFVYNYFAYFISTLPKNYQNLLTVIPLIVDFFVVGYIYTKSFKVYLPETIEKTKILSILMWLFTFGIKLAISGIRCSLAVSLAVLAIYLEAIQKKNRLLALLLYIAAIYIHNFAVVLILVRLLSALRAPVMLMFLSLGISTSLETVARFVVGNSKNEYLVFSFGRILDTAEDMSFGFATQSFSGVSFLIYLSFIVFSIYLFLVSERARRIYKEKGYCKTVANFAASVGAVAIGLSFNYLYLERFMYLVSFAFLMITPLHNRRVKRINFENLLLVPVMVFVFFFNDIYLFIVNYIGWFFLAL